MIKKLLQICLLAFLPLASLYTAENFLDVRTQNIQGSVTDDSDHVILELNPNSKTKKIYQVPVVGGQFNQAVPLEPGENELEIKSNSANETHVLKTKIKTPSLRFELTWPNGALNYNLHVNEPIHGNLPAGGSLDRDWTSGSGHGIENITFSQAQAGLYQVYVQYQSDNSTSSSSPTTLNVYLNEKLIQTYTHTITTSEAVSTLLNSNGESVWSVCSIVLNSGSESGGFKTVGDTQESYPEFTFLDSITPLTPFQGQSLTPTHATDPIQLYLGQSLNFTYSGLLNHQATTEHDANFLSKFNHSGVGSIDVLGNYYADQAGLATISVEGSALTTNLKILALSNFVVDSAPALPGSTLYYLEDSTPGASISLNVTEVNAETISENDLQWVNATPTTGTAASFSLETITDHIKGERIYAFLGSQDYINLNIIVLDPLQDSDSDGLTDWNELNTHSTHRLVADSDGDLINDGTEVAAGRDPLAKEWTVTFNLDGKATLDSGSLVQIIPDGGSASAPTLNVNTGYIFNSWDQSFDQVTGSITVTALFDSAYTVTFLEGDHGSITAGAPVQVLAQGSSAIAPTITPDQDWYFSHWDVDFSNIQGDLIVTAQYTQGYDVTLEIVGKGTGVLSHLLIEDIAPGQSTPQITVTPDAGSYVRIWSTGDKTSQITIDNVNSDMTVQVRLDDNTDDTDGDGILNGYEIQAKHNTNPLDFNDKPIANIFVDPNYEGVESGTELEPYNNIDAAISNATDYDIIQLAEGIYTNSDSVGFNINNKKITIISEKGPQKTIIDLKNQVTLEGFYLQNNSNETVVSGLMVRHSIDFIFYTRNDDSQIKNCVFTKNNNYAYIHTSNNNIENCIFNDNCFGTQGVVRAYNSEPEFRNCLLYDNHKIATTAYIFSQTGTQNVKVYNSILWNNAETNLTNRVNDFEAYNTIVENGSQYSFYIYENYSELDPQINEAGQLLVTSVAHGLGEHVDAPIQDILGQVRSDIVTIGPFDLNDTADNDTLPDNWELAYIGHLNDNASDLGADDLLSHGIEYQEGAFPNEADSDSDGLNDDDEYAVKWGLNDDQHKYRDLDGDGFTTTFELFYGTDPTDKTSFPAKSNYIFVDPESSANGSGTELDPFNILSSAINLAEVNGDYSIICVKPGVLKGASDLDFDLNGPKLMIFSEEGPFKTVFDFNYENFTAGRIQNSEDIVINGFTLRNKGQSGYWLEARTSNVTISNCVFEDLGYESYFYRSEVQFEKCIFRNNLFSQKLVNFVQSRSEFLNCAFLDNDAYSNSSNFVDSGWVIKFQNTIFYGKQIDDQFYNISKSKLTNSYIQNSSDTINGNIDAVTNPNPLINSLGAILTNSPLKNAGNLRNAPRVSFYNNYESSHQDIGPFSSIDSDDDGLPDEWEEFYLGDKSFDENSDTDADLLLAIDEYEKASNPDAIDTDLDGIPDRLEVDNNLDPSSYADVANDFDADGYPNYYELLYDSDPLDVNSVPDNQYKIFVDANAGSNGVGTELSPYDNIKSALQNIAQDSMVIVKAGEYNKSNDIGINANEEHFLLLAEEGPLNTIVDIRNQSTYFIKYLNSNPLSVMRGFHIKSSLSSYPLEIRSSKVRIINTIFSKNKDVIYCTTSAPTFVNTKFIGSHSEAAGVLFQLNVSKPEMWNCFFYNNYHSNQSSFYFFGTQAYAKPKIVNSIFYNSDQQSYNLALHYNISYSYIQSGESGIGNIDIITNPNPNVNSVGYLLDDSVCIDAGSEYLAERFDFDNQIRFGEVDLGPHDFRNQDPDNMSDAWELVHFGNLDQDGALDSDGDLVTDLEEYERGTNPNEQDSDGDGLDDNYEITNNLNPNDDSEKIHDFDGDGFINAYEIFYAKDPLDETDYPVSTIQVNPNLPDNSTGVFNNLQDAVSAASDYDIIELQEGLYSGPENYLLALNRKRIMLKSKEYNKAVIELNLRAANNGMNLSYNNAETVIDGLLFRYARGYPLNFSSDKTQIINCVFEQLSNHFYVNNSEPIFKNTIFRNSRIYDSVLFDMQGISEMKFYNCSIINNEQMSGSIFDQVNDNDQKVEMVNSIVWNNSAPLNSQITMNHCVIEGGYPGVNVSSSDPQINSISHLLENSPCINTGADLLFLRNDRWGGLRTGLYDIGPYNYEDVDADNIADGYEELFIGHLNQIADFDGDSLNTEHEYIVGSDPSNVDTDADGFEDNIDLSFNKDATLSDLFDDLDGDRYPNFYEMFYGTDVADVNDFPAPTRIVDASLSQNSGINYNNFKDAYTAASEYEIILVKDGIYTGSKNAEISIAKNMLVVSENGPESTVFDGEEVDDRFIYVQNMGFGFVLAGITMTNYKYDGLKSNLYDRSRIYNSTFIKNGRGVYAGQVSETKYENCIFKQYNSVYTSGTLVESRVYSNPIFNNCNFLNNFKEKGVLNNMFYSDSSSKANLNNCIVWGNEPALEVLDGTENVSHSYIEGGFAGVANIDVVAHPDPLISYRFYLKPDSPLIGAGQNLVPFDHIGYVRDSAPDIGAFCYDDTDGDQISDNWELIYDVNLDKGADVDVDFDYLSALNEYRLGSRPDVVDFDQDDLSDVQEFYADSNPYEVNQLDLNSIPFETSFAYPYYLSGPLKTIKNMSSFPLNQAYINLEERVEINASSKFQFYNGIREHDILHYQSYQTLASFSENPNDVIFHNPFGWFYIDATSSVIYKANDQWIDSSVTISNLSDLKTVDISVDYINSTWSLFIEGVTIFLDQVFPEEIGNTDYMSVQFSASDSPIVIDHFAIDTVLSYHLNFQDTDGDGIPDRFEQDFSITSATEDADGDGLSNLEEYLAGTQPDKIDSDGDGLSDYIEIKNNLDPNSKKSEIVWPYIDDFSSLIEGTNNHSFYEDEPLSVHDQNEWMSYSYDNGIVVTDRVWTEDIVVRGDPALDLSVKIDEAIDYEERGFLGKDFKSIYDRNIWLEFFVTLKQDVEINLFNVLELKVSPDGTQMLYKDPANQNWQTLGIDITDKTDDHEFNQVSINIDYENELYSLYLDEAIVITGQSFSNYVAKENSKKFRLRGSSAAPIYLDDFYVSYQQPTFYDADGDGLANGQELVFKTDPFKVDSDGDTLSDHFEMTYGAVVTIPGTTEVMFEDGMIPEDFLDTQNPWEITTETVHTGTYAIQSPIIHAFQSAVFEITADFGTTFNYWMKLSASSGRDYYTVYVDGVQEERLTGNRVWTQKTINLDPGVHTIKWVFERGEEYFEFQVGNYTYSRNHEDRAWLDFDINWPAYQVNRHLDPLSIDSDGDEMRDDWEITHGLNPLDPSDANADLDSDNLTNVEEYVAQTDPNDSDSDNDQMPDDWEIANRLNPNFDDSGEDPDQDTLSNLQEHNLGSNPQLKDTDGDGYDDAWENVNGFSLVSNDTTADSEPNGMADHWEAFYGVTDPAADPDGDGLTNLQEFQQLTDPNNVDSDGDGILDNVDANPLVIDNWNDPDGPTIQVKLIH